MRKEEFEDEELLNIEAWYQKYGIGLAVLEADLAEEACIQQLNTATFKAFYTKLQKLLRRMERYSRFNAKKIAESMTRLDEINLGDPVIEDFKKLQEIFSTLNKEIAKAKVFQRSLPKPDEPEGPEDEEEGI